MAIRLPPSLWTYWDIKGLSISYHVYVVWDVKYPIEVEVRVSVYLIIIIIIRPDIAINELMGRKAIFNLHIFNQSTPF